MLHYSLKKLHYLVTFYGFFAFLNMSRAWLFVFNTRSYIYSKCKALSQQKVYWINLRLKKSKSRLYSRTQEKIQHSSAIKKNYQAQLLVYLK